MKDSQTPTWLPPDPKTHRFRKQPARVEVIAPQPLSAGIEREYTVMIVMITVISLAVVAVIAGLHIYSRGERAATEVMQPRLDQAQGDLNACVVQRDVFEKEYRAASKELDISVDKLEAYEREEATDRRWHRWFAGYMARLHGEGLSAEAPPAR